MDKYSKKIELCSKEQCTGCMSCFNSCANGSIKMVEDKEGFLYPEISHSTCILCNKCVKSCPVITPLKYDKHIKQKVYAAWANDINIRKRGSSGGIFTVLSKYLLSNQGAVYGAAFDNDCVLRHKGITSIKDLKELQGSKYVQSLIGDTFKEIKQRLQSYQSVLFVGTPCQVDGLHTFLKNVNYKGQLYTCDLVCHGVPSPGWLRKYIKSIQPAYEEKITGVVYRNLEAQCPEAKIVCGNKIKNIEKGHRYFYSAFMKGLISRKCCFQCKYATINRVGDITLADFWGIGKKVPFKYNIKEGVSLVIVNTPNGEKFIDNISGDLTLVERSVSEAVEGNSHLSVSSRAPSGRDTFFFDFDTLNVFELVKKYKLKQFKKKNRFVSKCINMIDVLGLKRVIKHVLSQF